MDFYLAFCLFGCIFLLPAGIAVSLNPRLRKLGFVLAIIGFIGLIGSAILLYRMIH